MDWMTKYNLETDLPYVDRPARGYLRADGSVLFVKTHIDEFAVNPLDEFDGEGKIHSLNWKHINSISADDALEMLVPMVCPKCGYDVLEYHDTRFGVAVYQCDGCWAFSALERIVQPTDAVALGYYEHGRCAWAVRGDFSPLNCQHWNWDGIDLAGVWEPDDCTVQEANDLDLAPGSPERRAFMEKRARQACELYTSYVNGDVYGFVAELFAPDAYDLDPIYGPPENREEYDEDEIVQEFSCWGFYGFEGYKRIGTEIAFEFTS